MTVPPPSTVAKSVSPELDAIVLQALERDRKLRYARAAHMARDLDVFLQSHRFAVEDMAEYMKEVFPADAREDVPDGQMTSSYSIRKAVQEPTAPSSPRAIAGTPSAVRAEQVEKEAQAAAGRKRALVYGGAALLALAMAAIVVVPMARKNAAASKDEPRMVLEPIAASGRDGQAARRRQADRSSADGAGRRRGARRVGAGGRAGLRGAEAHRHRAGDDAPASRRRGRR